MAREKRSDDFFAKVLSLKDPWAVLNVTLSDDASRTDLSVGVRYGRKVRCPECGQWCHVHDRVKRTYRHLDVCESECYVTAEIPRTKCDRCGILQLKTPWARGYVSYTDAFERKAMSLLRSMPISKVAEAMRVGPWVIEGMMENHVRNALDRMDLSSVKNILLDETSSKRGHRYITVIADADTKKIIFMSDGRGADSLEKFSVWLSGRNGNANNIRTVCCDFSKPFLSGLNRHFPNADIVYDRFHLVKMANDAMDKIRAKNQMNGQRHKWIRFTLMRNRKNLSDDDKQKIFDIKNDNIVIGKAYEMKESLIQLYDYLDADSAEEHIKHWLNWVNEEGEGPMRSLGRTVSRHLKKILNWFSGKRSNGFLEGLNGMIQTTKRIGRGYPNTANFISMIYFRHGRLDA